MTGYHKPVLAEEVISGLHIKQGGIYADGTLGGGGHALMIAQRLGTGGTLIGTDRDPEAIAEAGATLKDAKCKVILEHAEYAGLPEVLKKHSIPKVDGVLLDLGVSSHQLDTPERGFSYMRNAPLDMRMDGSDDVALTAEYIVNNYTERQLEDVIKKYGEERWAKRIASFIVGARKEAPITTTDELTAVIKAAIPAAARKDGPHPSKRTFQALRIEVNDEIEPLREAVRGIIETLAPGGRFAVISFHSLEDRIVKEVFAEAENPCTCPPGLPVCRCGNVSKGKRVTRKPVTASEEELEENPRARSAKLRVFERV
jgi:16S rRNA (cytosine1402-N4)-methyltransferase